MPDFRFSRNVFAVVRNRDRYGFTYLTVHHPYLEAFAPVIDRLRPPGSTA